MLESEEFTDDVRDELMRRLNPPQKMKAVVVSNYSVRDDGSEKSFLVVYNDTLAALRTKLEERGKYGSSYSVGDEKVSGWIFGSRARTRMMDLFERNEVEVFDE